MPDNNRHMKTLENHPVIIVRISGHNLFMDPKTVFIVVFIVKPGHLIDLHTLARDTALHCRADISDLHDTDVLWISLHAGAQLCRVQLLHTLIAIQCEDPVVGCFGHCKVPGCTEIVAPREVKQLICVFRRDLLCSVRGACIDHHDLHTVTQQLPKTLLYVLFLVLCDQAHADW